MAIIGYARQPDFEVHPPNAITSEERIAYALVHRTVFRDACEQENINLRVAKRIVEIGVKREQRKDNVRALRNTRHRSKL